MSGYGYGAGPWGGMPWGGGDLLGGDIQFVAMRPVRENVIQLEFSTLVYYTNLLSAADAARPEKYTVTPIEGSVGYDGLPARPVTVVQVSLETAEDGRISRGEEGRFLLLTLDRPMSPYPARYLVEFEDIFSADLTTSTNDSQNMDALFKTISQPRVDQARPSRDLSNVQTFATALGANVPNPESAKNLGTVTYGDDGDYAFDEGLTNYKKRVLRRLSTKPGAFAHLPGYGVGIPYEGKKLAVYSRVNGLAAKAEAQIALEPETEKVKVRPVFSTTDPGIVRFQTFCKPRDGKAQMFTVPFVIPTPT